MESPYYRKQLGLLSLSHHSNLILLKRNQIKIHFWLNRRISTRRILRITFLNRNFRKTVCRKSFSNPSKQLMQSRMPSSSQNPIRCSARLQTKAQSLVSQHFKPNPSNNRLNFKTLLIRVRQMLKWNFRRRLMIL